MSIHTHNLRIGAPPVFKALGALAIGFALAQPAQAVPFTWDPAAIDASLSGKSFTADALKAGEVSRITFGPGGSWSEHGLAYITDATLGGSSVSPAGLGSDYTLYLDFSGTGSLATNTFTTANLTLYGVLGQSSFSIDANNNAHVNNNGNTPVVLAHSSLIWGTTGQTNQGDFFAKLLSDFTPTTPEGLAFFSSYTPTLKFYGDFFHPASVITPLPDGVTINDAGVGAFDTLSFVPEPASLALLAGGLPGWLAFRRRAQFAHLQ